MSVLSNDQQPLNQRIEAVLRGQTIQTSDLSDAEIQALLQALQTEQRRCADLYNFTPVGSLVVDEKGTILETNEIAAQLLDTDREAMVGQSILNFIFPADHAIYETRQHELKPGVSIQRYILRLRRGDGSLFRGRFHVARVAVDPHPLSAHTRIAISDVSELFETHESLRLAEERLGHILKVAPIAFFSQGLDLRFTWYYSSTASAESPSLVGKTDFDIMDDAEQARELYEFKRMVLESEHGNRQVFALLIQGQLQYWDVMVEPLYNQDGHLIGVTGAAVNITAQKEGEQERQQLQLERKKLHFMEGMLSETTHDLKAPLTAMISSLYLVQRANTDEDRQRHYERIEMLAMRLSRMLNDLSSILRLDELRTLTTRVLDLGLLLSEVVNEYRNLLDERHQLLKVSYPTSPCRVLANETYLYRAISNIISNASQYTPEGGRIMLRLFEEAEDAVLQIQDTGIGIAPEELPRIFDKFFRSKHARDMSKNGTGLGLAIARRVLEVHDGSIQVESEIGAGTLFIIRLPLRS